MTPLRQLARSAGRHLRRAVSGVLAWPARAGAGVASEATTLASAAGLALLTLAQPAFQETGPDWLRRLDLAVTFLDRDGAEIGRRGIRHEDRLPLSELSPHLIQAVIATEDRRFRRHFGIDPIGLGRALLANAEAEGVVQGGSTITQQLAKNLFLSGERTLRRKISEAFLAVWLEWRLSKDEILKLYLDRAYLGSGTFGVEAAASFYFGKSARDLTLPEAATLAGMLKAPSRYAPASAPGAARARAADVLDRMATAGFIGRAERDAAKLSSVSVAPAKREGAPDYFLDWAFAEVQRLAAEGRLGREADLVVRTSLDSALQKEAERAIEQRLAHDGERLEVGQASAVVMEPDGAVQAMVGGRDYGDSQFNRAVAARRQPGSAFKPFVYATALARTGLRPSSIVEDAEICLGDWCPANYGRTFAGPMPLATALARSVNTVAVWLTVEIGRAAGEWSTSSQARFGRARVTELAHSLGLALPLRDTPPLPLGSSEVTLLDLSSAYAAFAAGGLRARPHAVLSVAGRDGQVLYRADRDEPERRRVLHPTIAAEIDAMLAGAVRAGTARRAALPGRPTAGKTGTTNGYRDAWFLGFTGDLVAGIWFGNDDHSPMRQVTGGSLPAATWREIMAFAHRDRPSRGLFTHEIDPTVTASVSGRGGGAGLVPLGVPGGRGFEVVAAQRLEAWGDAPRPR